jgi:hypothetical protein
MFHPVPDLAPQVSVIPWAPTPAAQHLPIWLISAYFDMPALP